MRRVKATIRPAQPERRYLHADMSQRGQLPYYVQLRNKLPKIRIKGEFGTPDFETELGATIAAQIALDGNEGDYVNAQYSGTGRPCSAYHAGATWLSWYWNGYKHSDHWLGDLSVGHEGLAIRPGSSAPD
jgi:hypothetical protein